ncbi:MAG: antibiotic biosynthesis monooxygenase [Gammaproteobacteria bacterium]|nr:antibiotic biosynthesis monooxygenase [Gammaproteobacteria bacterium]MDH5694435.1 antibiotic biosynthesis monooxygenase [Gammaproteobacteria bacterium]
MYAVIFRAKTKQLDSSYEETAARLRTLAKEKYGCVDFVAAYEAGSEIVISYWPSLEQIAAWKQDPEHIAAQEKGRAQWYESFTVHVCKIEKDYGFTQ